MTPTAAGGHFTSQARVVHAAGLDEAALVAEPLDPCQILSGPSEVRHLPLVEGGDLIVGIWQHAPGTSTDVEADEIFVVLTGRATVAIHAGPTLDVGPGDVVLLPAGVQTVWIVHQTLRKVYVART